MDLKELYKGTKTHELRGPLKKNINCLGGLKGKNPLLCYFGSLRKKYEMIDRSRCVSTEWKPLVSMQLWLLRVPTVWASM